MTVLHGDCLDLMRGMADASVDAIITDPPYSSGGVFRSDRSRPAKDKAVGSGYVGGAPPVDRPAFSGDNRDQRSYAYWCYLWLSEALRLTRDGGYCIVFTDWRQLPVTSDALQAGGWVWRGIGVWDKTEAARPQKGWFRNQCEYLVWGTKGPITDNADLPCHPGVFRQSVAGDEKFHVAGKPVSVMRGVCRIVPPGGLILDPFNGSGTTGVAATLEGRRYVGIEREAAYVEIARRRLAEVQRTMEIA